MKSLSKLNLKKKIAAISLAAVAAIVPVTSCLFVKNYANADTGDLAIGEKIAFAELGYDLKNTICVKRIQLYHYTLYYEGTFDNVYVDTLHTPIYVTEPMDITFIREDQISESYSLTNSVSEKVTKGVSIECGLKVKDFLNDITGNITVGASDKYEKAQTVTESIVKSHTSINRDEIRFSVDGVNLPFNHYYGDVLMLFKAYKFRLNVYEFVIAKHRKSALHKWSDYNIEGTPSTTNYTFYSSYYENTGNYVRKAGDLGNSYEYEMLISNAGK